MGPYKLTKMLEMLEMLKNARIARKKFQIWPIFRVKLGEKLESASKCFKIARFGNFFKTKT